jgi:hypothetical protein
MYFQVITYSVLLAGVLLGFRSPYLRVPGRGPKNDQDMIPVYHHMSVLSWRMLEHYLPMLLLT